MDRLGMLREDEEEVVQFLENVARDGALIITELVAMLTAIAIAVCMSSPLDYPHLCSTQNSMTSESVMRREKLHPLNAKTKFEEIGVKCKSAKFEARDTLENSPQVFKS
jgi:hypothetical protein